MKIKYFLYILAIIIFFISYQSLIVFNKEIFNALIFGFTPSLFPALLLINIFIDFKGLDILYMFLNKNKISKKLYLLILIIFSFILGMPSMMLIAKDQYDKKIITADGYYNLIYSLGCVSFPFLSGILILNKLSNHKLLIIILIYLFINIFSLFIHGIKINTINIPNQQINTYKTLNKSCLKSIKNIALITSNVIIFSIPLFFIQKILDSASLYISSFIEFSYPLYKLINNPTNYNLCFILFVVLCPSLSIAFQCLMLNSDFKILDYYKRRIIIAIFSIFIAYIFLL